MLMILTHNIELQNNIKIGLLEASCLAQTMALLGDLSIGMGDIAPTFRNPGVIQFILFYPFDCLGIRETFMYFSPVFFVNI